jgi:hypothetical protein
MAEAFDDGVLPAMPSAPATNPDEAALTLAKQIAARDENSIPALLTALQTAGFAVRGRNGSLILNPTDASQGMAFDAWEVTAMAKLYDEGWQLSLEDLDSVLAKAIPQLGKDAFSGMFLKSMAASADDVQPLRFWSRLIVELGRQSTNRYDLASDKIDPHSVQLDAIQLSLILMRLAGDLRAASKPTPTPGAKTSSYDEENERSRFQPAVYHPNRAVRLILTDGGDEGPGQPCVLGDLTMTVLDANAIFRTTEWKALINLDEEAKTNSFNIVTILLKFVWTYAALNAEVKMDEPQLVRTKDMTAGDTRTLTARVWFEFDNWPMLNCLRPFLNLTGIDFGNLPNHGAATDVGVDWYLVAGGVDPKVNSGDPNFLATQANATVMFNNGSGTDGETYNKVTGEHGTTTIKVSGRPQDKDLTHFKITAKRKQMAVSIGVRLKGASTEKFLGELTDVIGPALGITTDWKGGLAGGLTEMTFRMHWQLSKVFTFPVKDWEPCHKGWQGTISYLRKLHSIESSSQAVPNLGCCRQTTHAVDLTEQREWNVNTSEGRYEAAALLSNWRGEYDKKDLQALHQTGGSYWCKNVLVDDRTETTTAGSDSGAATFSLVVNGSNFTLILLPSPQEPPDGLEQKAVTHRVVSSSGGNGAFGYQHCGKDDADVTEAQPVKKQPWFFVWGQPVTGTVDPKTPEELSGTRDFPDPADPTGKVTVSWELMHCEK